MSGIRFQLNGHWRTENAISPSMTVLDYLRLNARLTGTKEGCAEGDCGACTVVFFDIRWRRAAAIRAVNSCLMVVPQLDGCELLTVEGLAGRDGMLHSVQQALVDADATQCGFCTPGFAMAMFAFAHGGEARTDETIHEALAGNLCRCTGYRPIVEACRVMRADPPGCAAARDRAEANTEYRYAAQIYLAPKTLDDMAEAKARHPDAILLSGGTDLGLRVSKERETFPAIIFRPPRCRRSRPFRIGMVNSPSAAASPIPRRCHISTGAFLLSQHWCGASARARSATSAPLPAISPMPRRLATAFPA